MNIYVGISLFLIVFLGIDICNKNKPTPNSFFYIGAILITGLLAFRGPWIGGDTHSYVGFFNGKGGMYSTLDLPPDDFEFAFVYFCKLLALITRDNFIFLFLTSIITMIPFLYLIKRDCEGSKILPMCQYMLLWGILSTSQTALRQNLSVSCLMFAYIVWTTKFKKKTIKYIIFSALIIWSLLSHNSSLIAMMLFSLCLLIRFTKKSSIALVGGTFLLVLILKNIFYDAFSLFYAYFGAVGMFDKFFNIYYLNGFDFDYEISFNRLFPLTFFVCLIIWLCNEKEVNSTYFKMLVVGSTLSLFGASFPMLTRTAYPLMFIGIILSPVSLKLNGNIYSKNLVIILLLFFTSLFTKMKPGRADQMYPYTFIWEDNNVKTLKK